MKDSIANLLTLLTVCGFVLFMHFQDRPVQAQQPIQPPSYQQRFVQIQQPKDMIGVPLGLIALDTKTGVVCRTYEANFWKTVPLCSSL